VFFKPKNVMTTRKDPEGRKTIMDYFPPDSGLYPIGRLDFISEGLLLLTDDGELAYQIQHPRFEVPKTYLIWVGGDPRKEDLFRLIDGIMLSDGIGRFDAVSKKSRDAHQTCLEITVSEGRNRFIRRMLEEVNFEVRRLLRVEVGPVRLGNLKPGESRPLTSSELSALIQVLKIGSPKKS